ncbi:radical SAM protein [Phenylobacterium sp.]|uniref:B12-binding domain-containing radical SAM protein n=1 Tax=Phenylobacterium sp. TaxID=1871053 RepID=UPI00301BBDDE
MAPLGVSSRRVLIIDLNNFSSFPTLSIGLLVASLRNAGCDVRLLSPLAYDVEASERERSELILDHWKRRLHLSTWAPAAPVREAARAVRNWWNNRPHPRVLSEAAKALADKPDVLMLSAYLQHYPTVVELGRLAQAAGVPLLLGGPMFNIPETAAAWRTVPGLVALYGGEADLSVGALVEAVAAGGDLLAFDGVVLPDGRAAREAPPLRQLDSTPVPDFTDFPWDRYRVRIIPLMTGRGCQWSKCTFCSDVVSASGRTFRTRSLDTVLHEMREQARRHATSNFLFLDLKLNSNPAMFRGLAEHIQDHVPGAEWIGTVHVDQRADNGLSRRDLRAAVASGMRRISFGLESGSQRLLDLMNKGSRVEANAAFVREAHEAGLSVRCTMMKGYPGETAEDLEQTAAFLDSYGPYIDRVRFNDFSLLLGTPAYEAAKADPSQYPDLRLKGQDARRARNGYARLGADTRRYRRAKAQVLRSVYEINRRRIRSSARAFDGLM